MVSTSSDSVCGWFPGWSADPCPWVVVTGGGLDLKDEGGEKRWRGQQMREHGAKSRRREVGEEAETHMVVELVGGLGWWGGRGEMKMVVEREGRGSSSGSMKKAKGRETPRDDEAPDGPDDRPRRSIVPKPDAFETAHFRSQDAM